MLSCGWFARLSVPHAVLELLKQSLDASSIRCINLPLSLGLLPDTLNLLLGQALASIFPAEKYAAVDALSAILWLISSLSALAFMSCNMCFGRKFPSKNCLMVCLSLSDTLS